MRAFASGPRGQNGPRHRPADRDGSERPHHRGDREVLGRVMKKKGLARTPEEQLHRIIGETIRTLRKEKELTLKQMSRRTGLSISLLSQIERAESSPSISSLYKIAMALETKIQDLFGDN